ncbi:MAG: SGNH/GDSL hydrolase family protein [Acutalibacteraceae bacterium]
MKTIQKLLVLFLSVMLIAFCFPLYSFAEYYDKSTEQEGTVNLLVLGDSIAEGYGVRNASQAAYARIVADTNGYNYRNFARMAHDTADLLYEITSVETIVESVRWAYIIHISTGSNNYLANPDVVSIAIGALLGVNNRQLDTIADEVYADYLKIYDRIRELNPDATIILNNVYCAWSGLGYIPFIKASGRVNEKIELLQKAHEDILVLDIDSIITGHHELIAKDCVHPNAQGNVRIAKAMLELLKAHGLGEQTEPVVLTEGIDYNYYVMMFGKFGGSIIGCIIKILTLNF